MPTLRRHGALNILEDDHERVKTRESLSHEATGSPVQAIHAEAHRWRFSLANQPLKQSHLWDTKKKIGVCGDWFCRRA